MPGLAQSLTGAGGPILAVLAVLSVISVAAIVLKAIELWPVLRGQDRRAAALDLLRDGEGEAARDELTPPATAADRLTLNGIERLLRGGRPGLAPALEAEGNAAAQAYFRHIRLLETIAMLSPLLGLLGTVLGMIQAFRDLQMAGGAANAALLAGGIWQALLTTAAGLTVALPAAAGAALLAARAEAATAEIERIIGALVSVAAERDEAGR